MASKHTSSAVVPANADSHGLTVLRNSLHYFKEALNQFRVCHDLCAPRDLPDKDLAKKLERCADDFRVMSIDFAALAQEVASVWCRTCWIFYANIHKMSGSPEKILSTIGTQSKKLADGYERVAAMCAQLATKFTGREPTVRQEIQIQAEEQLEEQQLEEKREKVEKLNEAQATTELDTLREERTEGMGTDAFTMAEKDEQQSIEDQFKKAFENYLDEAIEEKKKAEEEHKQAQMLTQSADNRTKLPKWKKIFQRGAREADSDPEVHEVQRHAKAKLEEAQRKVDVRKDQYEKAKVEPFLCMHVCQLWILCAFSCMQTNSTRPCTCLSFPHVSVFLVVRPSIAYLVPRLVGG